MPKTSFIANEGKTIVYSVFGFFVFVWVFFGFCPFLLIVSAALAYIYKNPERDTACFECGALYSPADARIKLITSINDADIGENATLIVLKKRFFDGGVLRALTDMRIDNIRTITDKSKPNSAVLDELSMICQIQDHKAKLVIKKGFFAKNIYFYDGDLFRFKDRLGFLLCGEIGIIVSSDFRIERGVGERVLANCRLGYFAH